MRVGATICATICPCMPGAAGTFGALRRPLPRRVSVFDAFATPSWDYDFFLSSSLRLSRKEREGTCTPRAPRPNNCGVYGPDSVDPVRSWLMSLQTCAVSYESSLKVHATAWLRRAGVRVMSTYVCGTIMGTVRCSVRCSNSMLHKLLKLYRCIMVYAKSSCGKILIRGREACGRPWGVRAREEAGTRRAADPMLETLQITGMTFTAASSTLGVAPSTVPVPDGFEVFEHARSRDAHGRSWQAAAGTRQPRGLERGNSA